MNRRQKVLGWATFMYRCCLVALLVYLVSSVRETSRTVADLEYDMTLNQRQVNQQITRRVTALRLLQTMDDEQ